jgi:hypothetical protein
MLERAREGCSVAEDRILVSSYSCTWQRGIRATIPSSASSSRTSSSPFPFPLSSMAPTTHLSLQAIDHD